MSECLHTFIDIASLVISVGALCLLWQYVRETKTIAKNSAKQIESASKPLLVLKLNEAVNRYEIHNIGSGPALNILFQRPQYDTEWHPGGSLGAKESYRISLAHIREADPLDTFELWIRFESLSGRKYLTKQSLEGVGKTTFQEIF